MTDSGLSTQQIAVIDALSNGATATAAAAAAGVHRNTINNWRRNNLAFQFAFAHAQYDRALFYRERTESLVDKAYNALEALLADPKTPASVRLKAALYAIDKAATPPAPKTQIQLDLEKVRISPNPPVTIDRDLNIVHPVHNSAQDAQSAQSAQSKPQPIRREHPKIGRNETCPCGSGLKYKRCCLNKAA